MRRHSRRPRSSAVCKRRVPDYYETIRFITVFTRARPFSYSESNNHRENPCGNRKIRTSRGTLHIPPTDLRISVNLYRSVSRLRSAVSGSCRENHFHSDSESSTECVNQMRSCYIIKVGVTQSKHLAACSPVSGN